MTKVIISNNLVIHPDTGQRTASTVYHAIDSGCQSTPKPDSQYYYETDEETAKAFGRHLCGTCEAHIERNKSLKVLEDKANSIMDRGLKFLIDTLPDNFEVRILVHGYKKTPYTVWTSKPKDDT